MNDAILLAAIGLMLYGIVQHFRFGDEFWLSPIGNVIGAIGVTVVAGACFKLTLQDEIIILVAVTLGLYWFGKRKTPKKPATKQSFEQVFETVEVEPIVEENESESEVDPVDEASPAPEPVAKHSPFMWNGA